MTKYYFQFYQINQKLSFYYYSNFYRRQSYNIPKQSKKIQFKQFVSRLRFQQKSLQMIQLKNAEEKNTKLLYQFHQKDYVRHLTSLLPLDYQFDTNSDYASNAGLNQKLCALDFFNNKTIKLNRSSPSLTQNKIIETQQKKAHSTLSQFLLKLIKSITKQKSIDETNPLQNISKELGIDMKQLRKLETQKQKIEFLMNSIDRHIEDQKKKISYPSKSQGNTSVSSTSKQNNFQAVNEQIQKIPSKYEQFIKEQNKKDVDNFGWLQINTKYPMLKKKLKFKLIQSINEDLNEKKIRVLINKKQLYKKSINTHSTSQCVKSLSISKNQNTSLNKGSFSILDEKVDLTNESLFMEEFENAKIDYFWTDNDEKMFLKNIQQLKKKCANNRELLQLSGRFKFISQKQFQTLASQEISRALNKNNKIYLSREFLLDKYFSTTQILTEQQMRFILKTSPMLSKCVDRNFIKTAIKNIKYQNISDLELKIAEDIIVRFQKLRNTVRESRKLYKKQINNATKEKIVFFEKNQQLQIAKLIAKEELKKHKIHLMRAINYSEKYANKSRVGLSEKSHQNVCTLLNKNHPFTGLFVKDCNQQCNDDIFNRYEKQYFKCMKQANPPHKKIVTTKAQMIKCYTGGPDDNILTTFNVSQSDIKNICFMVKAHFFQKKILAALQFIEINRPQTWLSKRQQTMISIKDNRNKVAIQTRELEDLQTAAKKKLIQNKQKAKQALYVKKLLSLAASNSYQSLRALNPHFKVDEINTKDKKGNTALLYTTKFGNEEFVDYLLKFGANPNIKCEKDFTPLHLGFKSNNVGLIVKLLSSFMFKPNLNALDSEYKTPLAYCSRQVLKKLNLQQGVVSVDPKKSTLKFDNNSLLRREAFDKIKEERLEVQQKFESKVNENKISKKLSQIVTSIQNI